MSATRQVKWIGPKRFVPPLGTFDVGDIFYVTDKQYESLKAQGLVQLITLDEESTIVKRHKRQEVG